MLAGFALFFVIIFGFGLFIIPVIFFLLTLQNTMSEVSIENRKMSPGQVWLILIPLFGIIWQFIVVNNIADSLKLEFTSRNINAGEDRPGSGIGLAYCILTCCSIIPVLGIFTAIAGFICWIFYWVRISDFKTKLQYSKAQ